jgi:hypothetical protein
MMNSPEEGKSEAAEETYKRLMQGQPFDFQNWNIALAAHLEEYADLFRPGKLVFTDGAVQLEQEFKPFKPTEEKHETTLASMEDDSSSTDGSSRRLGNNRPIKKRTAGNCSPTEVFCGGVQQTADQNPFRLLESIGAASMTPPVGKMWIVVEGGNIFEGNEHHWADCFFTNVSGETVRDFCKQQGWSVVITTEAREAE